MKPIIKISSSIARIIIMIIELSLKRRKDIYELT